MNATTRTDPLFLVTEKGLVWLSYMYRIADRKSQIYFQHGGKLFQ